MSNPSLKGGAPLEKRVTDGGHEATQTEQPAFPDFHRKLADPSAFSWFALGAPFILIGLNYIGSRGLDLARSEITNAPAALGFMLLTLSVIFEFISGRTFPATLFGVYGGYFGGVMTLHVSWFGLTGAYETGLPGTYSAMGQGATEYWQIQGLWLSTFIILTTLLLVAATRQSGAVCATLLFLDLYFILAMVHAFGNGTGQTLANAAGAFAIVGGIFSWYLAAASLLTKDSSFFTIPTLDLAKND